MSRLLASENIYVGQSDMPNAGRGVFARVDIQSGELVERCPVIALEEHDAQHISETMLVTYIYFLGEQKDRAMITLGFGSIYNHSSQANAKYVDRSEEQLIDFVAIKDIKKDEEILVNYVPVKQDDSGPLWFETE